MKLIVLLILLSITLISCGSDSDSSNSGGNLFNIKDISKFERQIFLKRMTPKMFFNLYKNISFISDIYDKVIKDTTIKEYLELYEKNILYIKDFCNELSNFIDENIHVELAKEIDNTQYFDVNFIKTGVDNELDTKTNLFNESQSKLEAIRNYLNNLIHDKGKTIDFIKIHETEKNNFSLICTSRRCKMLELSLPSSQVVTLNYISKTNCGKEVQKEFQFVVCKKTFEYTKQSASNNFITDSQISALCKNITNTKTVLKELITTVFNKFSEKFEVFLSCQYPRELPVLFKVNLLFLIDSFETNTSPCKVVMNSGVNPRCSEDRGS
jgi:hypothetical protein